MAKFSPTLLACLSLMLVFTSSSNADVSAPHRRDHSDLGRLIKKRAAPNNILGNLQPSLQGEETSSISSPLQSTPATSAAAQTTPANSAQTSSVAVSSSVNTASSGGGLLSSVVGGLLPTQSSSPLSTASTASSSASNPSSSTPAQAQGSKVSVDTPTQSVVYLTTSGAPTPTQTSSTSSSSGMSHAAVTVLIIIAASIGAAGIAWTIIRKWKFRPSSDFDSRMQPIDWQPGANDDDSGLPGRRRPISQASSFHSGSAHGQVDGGYGSTTLNPIPDHDFTAGPAHLTPVGGYADLARGPSPQPMMQEALGRSPSINVPVQHDQYGVPLHHGY